jgi:hypothetical protein
MTSAAAPSKIEFRMGSRSCTKNELVLDRARGALG